MRRSGYIDGRSEPHDARLDDLVASLQGRGYIIDVYREPEGFRPDIRIDGYLWGDVKVPLGAASSRIAVAADEFETQERDFQPCLIFQWRGDWFVTTHAALRQCQRGGRRPPRAGTGWSNTEWFLFDYPPTQTEMPPPKTRRPAAATPPDPAVDEWAARWENTAIEDIHAVLTAARIAGDDVAAIAGLIQAPKETHD